MLTRFSEQTWQAFFTVGSKLKKMMGKNIKKWKEFLYPKRGPKQKQVAYHSINGVNYGSKILKY